MELGQMEATPELRWEKASNGRWVLMQKFYHFYTNSEMWVEVPKFQAETPKETEGAAGADPS